LRTFAIVVAALASAALSADLSEAKTTHHARANARPAPALASPVTRDDARAVAELAKTGLAIQAELNTVIASVYEDQKARRGGPEDSSVLYIECFQSLEGATAELTGDLKELLVAASTASQARDQSDLTMSLGFTRLALLDVGDAVGLVWKVSGQRRAPTCQSSRLYRDYVGRLQKLAHDVTGVTDNLSGATVPQ